MSDAPNDVEEEANVWEQAVGEMRELAAERAADGWETVTVHAGETTPEPPSEGDSDRFGIVYTIPDNVAEEVRSVVENASVDEYTVYRRNLGSTLFLVTEFADSDAEVALFVAGAVNLQFADELFAAATERGEMYSHLQLLDWTQLASFRHDDPSAFIPERDDTDGT
jgi:L-rhamnose mutarotase